MCVADFFKILKKKDSEATETEKRDDIVTAQRMLQLLEEEERERKRERLKMSTRNLLLGLCVCVLNHTNTHAVSGCVGHHLREGENAVVFRFPFPTFRF